MVGKKLHMVMCGKYKRINIMAANTPRGRKAKGREFQNLIRKKLLEVFPQLEGDDIKCALMSESGEDIKLSPSARKLIPYSIEAKRQEKLNIWASLEQAEKNTKDQTYPVLFFKRNRSKMYVALEAEHFFDLLKKIQSIDNAP
jgi:hypothetical protein